MAAQPVWLAVTAATFAGLSADDFPDGQIVVVTDDGNQLFEARGADAGRTWQAVGLATIDNVADVDTTTAEPEDGQVLVWSAADGSWVPGTVSGGAGGGTPVSAVSGALQSTFWFFGPEPRASEALSVASTGGAYDWPGDALSGSIQFIHLDEATFRDVVYAEWNVVWTPDSSSNGVRLVHALPGPTDITEIARFDNNSATTPLNSSVDITAAIQALVDAGDLRQLGHQLKAVGTGMKVYTSRVSIVWKRTTVSGGGGGGAGEQVVTEVDADPPVAVTTEDGSDWVYSEV